MASLGMLCSNPLNLKNKITKIEHKTISCEPSKILKNISWLINICLKYFMTPTKTLHLTFPHTLCTVPNKQKLVGLDIDRNLSFNEYLPSLSRKAGNKLFFLARPSYFMSFNQRHILLKTFTKSQFEYCPLIWMLYSRRVNNKINHSHERSLRTVYEDNYSSSMDLLAKGKSFTIDQRNIQSLAIELFKVKRNYSNVIMCNILKTRTLTYNLR